MNVVMIVSPRAASLVYIVWVDAAITATLRAVYEVGDARSTTRCSVDIHLLESTHFSVINTPSAKFEDVLLAKWGYVKQRDHLTWSLRRSSTLEALLHWRMRKLI